MIAGKIATPHLDFIFFTEAALGKGKAEARVREKGSRGEVRGRGKQGR